MRQDSLSEKFDRRGRGESVHLLAVLIGIGMIFAASNCRADDSWGGSFELTSDYLVRGISRTNDQAAVQFDLHYSNSTGFLAGVFASNAQFVSSEARQAELSGFVGFAWHLNSDWRSTILASHYAYPWSRDGANYNYDELEADIAYQDWLHFSLEYSPNSPRYVSYSGLISVGQESAEVNLQRQLIGKLSAIAGVGYSFLQGPDSGGYTYWSAGASYDWRSVSLVLSYVDTTAEAKALFYNAAASGRFTGTVIWRF
jgi:uncharacterized protein (TIGR02001 family)